MQKTRVPRGENVYAAYNTGGIFKLEKTEMAQNLNHFASNSISVRILSHLNFFELKKVSHFGKKTRDPYFEEKIKEKWMVRILSHLDFKCISSHVSLNSFDDFLSHLTIPPVY